MLFMNHMLFSFNEVGGLGWPMDISLQGTFFDIIFSSGENKRLVEKITAIVKLALTAGKVSGIAYINWSTCLIIYYTIRYQKIIVVNGLSTAIKDLIILCCLAVSVCVLSLVHLLIEAGGVCRKNIQEENPTIQYFCKTDEGEAIMALSWRNAVQV